MKPVFQTIFGAPGGNCHAACVASILELSIEDVPNFCSMGDNWQDLEREWLRERGWAVFSFNNWSEWAPSIKQAYPDLYLIVGGKSPRYDYLHAVVYRGVTPAHDPHPDGTFIVGEPKDFDFYVALDAGKFRLAASESRDTGEGRGAT